jgi:hypothetical protein
MSQTVYAKFMDARQCVQAAGALLDIGVRKEDIALFANTEAELTEEVRAVADTGYRGGETRGILLDRQLHQSSIGMSSGLADRESVTDDRYRFDNPVDEYAEPGMSQGYIVTDARAVDVSEGMSLDDAAKEGISITTPADAGAGAAKGAAWGLGLGVLAGLASIAVPGVGIVIGGGALATAIAGALGATVAGAAAGGVVGYLREQGMPQYIASDYESGLRQGAAMMAVTIPSNDVDSDEASSILRKYGAVRVDVY